MHALLPFSNSIDQGSVLGDLLFFDESLVTLRYYWPEKWALDSKALPHELWTSTCFEAFIMPTPTNGSDPLKSPYFEINLSLLGQSNFYSLDSYRAPFPPKTATSWELLEFDHGPGHLNAVIKTTLSRQSVKVGLTCILDLPQNKPNLSYWALNHAGPKPDFHLPQSFILERSIS